MKLVVLLSWGGGVGVEECYEWDPLPSEVRCARVLIPATNGSFVTADLTSLCARVSSLCVATVMA